MRPINRGANLFANGLYAKSDTAGVVLLGPNTEPRRSAQHEHATLIWIAQRLAALKAYEFGGGYDPCATEKHPRYLVPRDTLVGIEAARAMGIASEADLFGGLVPFSFMATKTITHPTIEDTAARPDGWLESFPARVQSAVLFGFAAFSQEDARRACTRVLERGEARLKPGRGVGGKGQEVVSTLYEADRALRALDPAELLTYGICIEENLQDVTTYSIGSVKVDELRISYCGTQQTTRDHRGKSVYGGSDLIVVRGGFAQLVSLDLAPELRQACEQAQIYDDTARSEIPGFLASRRNYDVAAGVDYRGRRRCGVLEQSWRLGGASPAEIAALEAFRGDPALKCVRAACPELYDTRHEPPPHARVSFRGEDAEVGPLVKYSVVEKYDNTR